MTRRLSSEERHLWSRVARTVRPRAGRTIELEEEEPPRTGVAAAPLTETKGEARRPPRRTGPPQDVSGQRRVRRGQTEIDARLDLHGHTQDTAHRELATFILRQYAAGSRCVLVITGKGRLGAGVLRARLSDWIGDPDLRTIIAGHARAHARHGGEGATYIFLKARRAEP